MASKACCVSGRNRLECSLLQPESIAERRRRFCHILVIGLTLRVERGVTDNAAFFRSGPTRSERSVSKRWPHRASRHDLDVLIVRKADLKICRRELALRRCIEDLARIRERVPRAIARARIRMTDRADHGSRAAEELLPVTVQA